MMEFSIILTQNQEDFYFIVWLKCGHRTDITTPRTLKALFIFMLIEVLFRNSSFLVHRNAVYK
jgi:hypothetical protein